MEDHGIRIGTCSWKYDSWRGLVYPETGKINYLESYAEKFNTVEIDQWFWSLFSPESIKLPDEKVVREYAESVPDDFRFTVKVPNSITLTHAKNRGSKTAGPENPHFLSPGLFRQFLERLRALEGKIGALIFQFEYLNRQKMKSQQEFQGLFSEFIQACPRQVPCAVETRNPNYLNRDYFEFLLEHDLKTVLMQGYYMPDITATYNDFNEVVRGLTVIRLMGKDRTGIEVKTNQEWNRVIDPHDDDLGRISRLIHRLRSKEVDVYVNVNNHYEGSAPLTIQRLKDRLRS